MIEVSGVFVVCIPYRKNRASQVALVVNNPSTSAGDIRDMGLIPGWGRSPGREHGNPLRYSSWRIPPTEEPGGLQPIGLQSQTRLK